LLARIHLVPDPVESMMLIGHNPSLQQLALDLASAGYELRRLETKFPTGALATIVLTKSWGELGPADALLMTYVVPKELR
jgi:phosphohistidine phosphatase